MQGLRTGVGERSGERGFAQHGAKGGIVVAVDEIGELKLTGAVGFELAGGAGEAGLLRLTFGGERGEPIGAGDDVDGASGDNDDAGAAARVMIVDARDGGVDIALRVPDDLTMLGDAGEAGAQIERGDANDLLGDGEIGLLVDGGGVAIAGEVEGAQEVVGLMRGDGFGHAAYLAGGAERSPAGDAAADGLIVDDAQHIGAVLPELGGPLGGGGVIDEAGDALRIGDVPAHTDGAKLGVGHAGERELALDGGGGGTGGGLEGFAGVGHALRVAA